MQSIYAFKQCMTRMHWCLLKGLCVSQQMWFWQLWKVSVLCVYSLYKHWHLLLPYKSWVSQCLNNSVKYPIIFNNENRIRCEFIDHMRHLSLQITSSVRWAKLIIYTVMYKVCFLCFTIIVDLLIESYLFRHESYKIVGGTITFLFETIYWVTLGCYHNWKSYDDMTILVHENPLKTGLSQ